MEEERKGEGSRPPGDGVGESDLKDESLDHFLDLTFLFLFLFLPQMNWVSITGQDWGKGWGLARCPSAHRAGSGPSLLLGRTVGDLNVSVPKLPEVLDLRKTSPHQLPLVLPLPRALGRFLSELYGARPVCQAPHSAASQMRSLL